MRVISEEQKEETEMGRCRRCKRCGLDSRVGKIPWRKKCQPTGVFLPGRSCGQRSLVGYSLCSPDESDTTEQGSLKVTKVPTGGEGRKP